MDYMYEYGMEGFEAMDMAMLNVMLAFYLVFGVVMLAVSVTFYVLQSLGLYRIAQRRGIHNPWLAWFPVGAGWILGSVSDQYQYVAKGRVRNRRKVLLGLDIGTYAAMIPMFVSMLVMLASLLEMPEMTDTVDPAFLGSFMTMMLVSMAVSVVAIVLAVFKYMAYYDLFNSCSPGTAVVFLVLSILFTNLAAIFVFVDRNKDEGMPPRKQPTVVRNLQPLPTEDREEL